MREIPTQLLQNYDVNRLPSLPHILIELLNACMDECVSFDIISDIISSDTALTAKVLSAANSPIYGHASQLTSLKHTLMFLGLDTIKSIAITASVQQFFSRYNADKGQQLAEFWEHSLLTALIAKSVAELVHYHSPDEAYLAALLHDIGQLVFQLDAQQNYHQLLEQSDSPEQLILLEQQHYQVSHDELGAYLLSEWGLSSFISDAVRYHHAPEELIHDAHLLVKILNMANRVSYLENQQAFDCSIFDLSINVVMDIIQHAREQLVKISRSMGIDIHNKQNFDDKQVELARQVKAIALSQSSFNQAQADLQFNINYSSQLLFNIKSTALFIYNGEDSSLYLEYPSEDICIQKDSSSIINQCLLDTQITSSVDNNDTAIIDRQIINLLSADGIICLPLKLASVKYGVLVMGSSNRQLKIILKNKFQLKLFADQLSQYYVQLKQDSQNKSDLESTVASGFLLKAREIVHETNNPLSVINNYLQILSNKFSEDDSIKNDLTIIQNEIERVGNIILRCTEEASHQADSSVTTDINESISQLINIYKFSLFVTHKTKCTLNLRDDLPNIHTNNNYLKQIISNLIKNAVESMPVDGALDISTNKTNVNGKNFISISIKDNGPGIPDDILSNLYMPVQTTKDNSHSGLGLSIVKNMLDKLQGSITCDTGKSGTNFTLLIPLK